MLLSVSRSFQAGVGSPARIRPMACRRARVDTGLVRPRTGPAVVPPGAGIPWRQVSVTMGISLPPGKARSHSTACWPGTSGSCMSMTITSGASARAAMTAATPLTASRTVQPESCRTCRSCSRATGSASTTKARRLGLERAGLRGFAMSGYGATTRCLWLAQMSSADSPDAIVSSASRSRMSIVLKFGRAMSFSRLSLVKVRETVSMVRPR